MSEQEEFCNEPPLCNNCNRSSEWPRCMENTKLRGYHPVFVDSWDDVVECGNYEP